MLPGFRFLLAAIALSVAIPVFGLGVASLFHAAQQDFAGNVVWHSPPETRWTQPMPAPVLAMLQVDPPAARTITSDIPPSPASGLGDKPVDSTAAQPVLAAGAESDPANPAPSSSGIPVSNEPTSNNPTSAPAVAPPENKADTSPLAANPTAVATETVQAPPAAESEAAKPLQSAEAESTPVSGTTGPVGDADRQEPLAVATLTPSSASVAASAPVATKAAANAKPTAARKPARAKRIARRQRRVVHARAATPAVQPQPFQQASDPFAQPFAQPAAGRRLR